MNTEKAKGIGVVMLFIVAIVVIIIVINKIFKGARGLTDFLGLTDSAEVEMWNDGIDNAIKDRTNKGASSEWSIQFWKKYYNGTGFGVVEGGVGTGIFGSGQLYPMSQQSAIETADNIYRSVSLFKYKPEEGAEAIRRLRSKSQVSFVANGFANKYGKDLLDWLNDEYRHYPHPKGKEQLFNIVRYVSKLPNV